MKEAHYLAHSLQEDGKPLANLPNRQRIRGPQKGLRIRGLFLVQKGANGAADEIANLNNFHGYGPSFSLQRFIGKRSRVFTAASPTSHGSAHLLPDC